ncbi:hypothetical protein [Priestia megaterium]|uniref:hypothetical protein n=1 Tax=Priestia megaterium TaxID=1404 RepID=UPI000BFB8E38|nr:hypothetical protein [Priestia megaterium]PGQ88261.1 hypothetical protein COA18_04860 [Priestia megaterium]
MYLPGVLRSGGPRDLVPAGYVIITPKWLIENGCFGENLEINIEKLDEAINGRPHVFIEDSFLSPSDEELKMLAEVFKKSRQISGGKNEQFVALDEAHVLAPFPFNLMDNFKKGEEQ